MILPPPRSERGALPNELSPWNLGWPRRIELRWDDSQSSDLPLIYSHKPAGATSGADPRNRTAIAGSSDRCYDHVSEIGENWWISGESNPDLLGANEASCHCYERPMLVPAGSIELPTLPL